MPSGKIVLSTGFVVFTGMLLAEELKVSVATGAIFKMISSSERVLRISNELQASTSNHGLGKEFVTPRLSNRPVHLPQRLPDTTPLPDAGVITQSNITSEESALEKPCTEEAACDESSKKAHRVA